MRSFGVISFVLVALSSAAVPAYANAPTGVSVVDGGSSSYLNVADSSLKAWNYWTASSEYYVETPGRTAASVTAPRRVLITGWHPVEGFEAEIAAEAANRAAHTAQP